MATYNKICYGGSDQCAVEYAVKAGHQTTADSATTATSATSAGTATSASEATKLATARSIGINLQSYSATSFDGTADITPGVFGVLPIQNGGTGSNVKNFVDTDTINQYVIQKTFIENLNIYRDIYQPYLTFILGSLDITNASGFYGNSAQISSTDENGITIGQYTIHISAGTTQAQVLLRNTDGTYTTITLASGV